MHPRLCLNWNATHFLSLILTEHMFNLHFRYTYSRQREQRHREVERENHDMRIVSALFFLTQFATQLFIINTKLVRIKLEL